MSLEGVSGSRRQRMLGYLKAKRDEYMGYAEELEGSDRFTDRSIDRSRQAPVDAGVADEQLVVYPSYCVRAPTSGYLVEVRGWLYIPGLPSRKNRLLQTLVKQLMGYRNSGGSEPSSPTTPTPPAEELLIDVDAEEAREYRRVVNAVPRLRRTSTSQSSLAPSSEQDTVLKARLAPFFARGCASRELRLEFVSADSTETATLVTGLDGRFSTRVPVQKRPQVVRIVASADLSTVEPVLDMDGSGVSVITDIDDTIRNTGITVDKREALRNVLVRPVDTSAGVPHVASWYQQLFGRGVKFHYVSNGPWQLYESIAQFLGANGFPPGSVHLKLYSGVLAGILEPSEDKKKSSLYRILTDFPTRKFILIGDSGEHDLEAYCDLATMFPNQVLAIYIRDVTLSEHDKTLDRVTTVSKDLDLIDLGDGPDLPPQDTIPQSKARPKVPPKPDALRPKSQRPKSQRDRDLPPDLPPRPSPSPSPSPSLNDQPMLMESTQNDYGQYVEILDKKVEGWRARVLRARSRLPPDVHLRLWRTGQDLDRESLRLCGPWTAGGSNLF